MRLGIANRSQHGRIHSHQPHYVYAAWAPLLNISTGAALLLVHAWRINARMP
jgi:hypothetical protein